MKREPSDAELVAQVLQNHSEAYTQLVERYRDAIYGLVYHYVGDFEEARDLTQETFVKAYLHLAQLQDPRRFGAWLRQIAVNECLMSQRRRRNETSLEEMAARNEEPSTGDEADRIAVRLMVRKALACLSEASRLTVTLFYVDGYTYSDIASFLDVPVSTVRSRLRNARARLRKEMVQMVEETLKGERPDETFGAEVVKQALERAKEAHQRWFKEEFLASCREALDQLDRVPEGEEAYPLRREVFHLLGDAEGSWLGEPSQAVPHYEEALGLAQQSRDRVAEVEALKALYLLHLRHGDFEPAGNRAREAVSRLTDSDDGTARAIARAAQDLSERLPGRWEPAQVDMRWARSL